MPRPSYDDPDQYREPVKVGLNKNELKRIDTAAEKAGQNRSLFMRIASLKEARGPLWPIMQEVPGYLTRDKPLVYISMVTPSGEPLVHLSGEEIMTLQTRPCEWRTLRIEGLVCSMSSTLGDGVDGDLGLMGLTTPSEPEDMLPPEHDPSMEGWRRGSRYMDGDGEQFIDLRGDNRVIGRDEVAQLKVRAFGTINLASVTLICKVTQDDRDQTNDEAADESDSLISARAARSSKHTEFHHCMMRPFLLEGNPFPSFSGGASAIGPAKKMVCKNPSGVKYAVLHSVLVASFPDTVDWVGVLNNLKVTRDGKPRTPDLMGDEQFGVVDDYRTVSQHSNLRSRIILGPGDDLEIEMAAFGNTTNATGKLFVQAVIHRNLSQKEASAWVDAHKAKKTEETLADFDAQLAVLFKEPGGDFETILSVLTERDKLISRDSARKTTALIQAVNRATEGIEPPPGTPLED